MPIIKNKLSNLSLGKLILINTAAIIAFMSINSLICSNEGNGDCIKKLDNRVFLFQIIANFLFAWYYIIKIDKAKWIMLLVNILLITAIYFVAGTLHSISKAGLF
jgi:hypothetical protein